MEYRFDLDSLRGIALLFVFIYHFNKNILPSGYIGVDIFFILSGYVITLSNTRKVPWIDFYSKRIVRLYPQQILCLYIVFIKVCRVKSVTFTAEVDNIISSLLGYSNYHFYFISIDYLQSFNSPSNVLHFWSLSVENQFYLYYPLLIYVFKFIYFYLILYILLIVLCIYESIYYSKYAYYSLSSRINEFILGLLLTFSFNLKYFINKNYILLGLIIISSIDRKWIKLSFPLPFLFIVESFISYLIINKKDNNNLLNSKILNKLGKISYSFYLFHYPIINSISKRNLKYFVYIFLVILLISIFTTNFIEKPLRISKHIYILSIILMIVITFFLIVLKESKLKYRNYISIIIHNSKNNKENDNSYLIQTPSNVNYNWNCNYYHKLCWCPFLKNDNKHNEKYIFANIFKKNVLFLIGDSHLEQWSFLIYPYARMQGYTLLELYCNMKYIESENYDWLFGILNQFKNKHYAVISNLLYQNLSSISFQKYINNLLNSFKFIYIIQDTPHFDNNPNNCLIQNVNKFLCFGIINNNASIVKYPIINNKRLFYIDLNDYICNKGKCPFIYNGYPVYKDSNHLNLNFTYFLKNVFFIKGFELDKVNDSSSLLCNTAVWCRRDWSLNHFENKC